MTAATASPTTAPTWEDVDPFQYVGKVKGRRKGPYPQSILDKKALQEALDEAGVPVKPIHIDGFYQSMHRQHYPSLRKFVENYYVEEKKANSDIGGIIIDIDMEVEASTFSPSTPGSATSTVLRPHQQDPSHSNRPLRNAVTNRKNRNKQQLPKRFLQYLATTEDFVTSTSRVKQQLTSKDKSTTKLIVELHDGFVVESVLMRYDQKGAGRASLCVSSQCGCAMGCTFCATGTMGLSGNLTTGEILEQLVHADRILADEWLEQQKEQQQENKDPSHDDTEGISDNNSNKKSINLVRNVVFMGMGEPLDNYSNVTEACRAMIDRNRWNLAHGRVTVSTVGLISQIRRLTKELPEVSLALSLHAPNQAARTAIVPTATRYPIEGLIDAVDAHMMAYVEKRRQRKRLEHTESGESATVGDSPANGDYTEEERINESSRRRAMIEYVMLEGETSSFECAHQLGKLCENRHMVVNLIPYNATDVKDKLRCPSIEHMMKFREIVQSYGTFCTIRRTMGADIASACGQLVKKDTDAKKEIGDIEDTVVGREFRSSSTTTSESPVSKSIQPQPPAHAITSNKSETQEKILVEVTTSWFESRSVEELEYVAKVLAATALVSAMGFVATSLRHMKRQ